MWKYSSTRSLSSTMDRGRWLEWGLGRCDSHERDPGTSWVKECLGPTAGFNIVKENEPNRDYPIFQLVAQSL